MTLTGISVADPAIATIVSKKALRDAARKGFWARFTGDPGSGAAIVQKMEALNGPGDTVVVPITSALTGAGVSEETTLDGQEEALAISSQTLVPVFRRHAVRVGRLAQYRSSLDLAEEARVRLGEWGASKADALRYTAYSSASGSPNVTYTGGRSSIGAVTTADVMTVAEVRKLRLKAKNLEMPPLKGADGSEFYGLTITPQSAYDLKTSTGYDTAVITAGERGTSNPWMTGMIGVIDGVAIFEDKGVNTATDGASSARVARSILFGQEAFVEAWAEQSFWSDQNFDYDGEQGVSWGFSAAFARSLVVKNSCIVYTASA